MLLILNDGQATMFRFFIESRIHSCRMSVWLSHIIYTPLSIHFAVTKTTYWFDSNSIPRARIFLFVTVWPPTIKKRKYFGQSFFYQWESPTDFSKWLTPSFYEEKDFMIDYGHSIDLRETPHKLSILIISGDIF